MDFQVLFFGAAKLKRIEAISLFSGVEPQSGNPEFPAKEASEVLIEVLKKMIIIP